MSSIDEMKNWLVIYDITNPRRLQKVAKIMEDYGRRVQNSVFEILTTTRVINELKNRIEGIIRDDDFVVYFELCSADWQKQMKYGPGKYDIMEEREYYIV